jgi:hypothetical protein
MFIDEESLSNDVCFEDRNPHETDSPSTGIADGLTIA